MGQGMLIRDNTNENIRLNGQTLQAAYSNGLIADAKDIHTSDPLDELNRPHMVDDTCANIPANLSWGVREVFIKIPNAAILITINGVTNTGVATIWHSIATIVNGTLTKGDWVSMEKPEVFSGTDGISNGTAGLVPAPSSSDTGKSLLSNGNWGYPKRTVPIVSCTKNATTGIITTVYQDGSSEQLEVSADETVYTITEFDSNGNGIRRYITTVAENGDYTTQISDI